MAINHKALQKSWNKFKSDREKGDVVTLPSQQTGYWNFESSQFSINRPYPWAPVYQDARDLITHSDRLALMRRSSFLELNFPQYSELINCVARFSVGRGIIPIPSTTNTTYNTLADFTFSQWSENRFCDVEKQRNFYAFTRYVAERMVAEGEVFVLLITSKDGYPRLQAISPLRVRSSSDSTDKSIDGIWYSSIDEPIAYNIFDLEDPGDSQHVEGKYTIVSAENVIHLFNPVAATQGHGIPWAQSAFNDMQDVKDAMKLTMNAVKNEALFSYQMQDTTGKGGPNVIDGMAGQKMKVPSSNQNIAGDSVANRTTFANPQGITNISNPTYMERLTVGTLNRIANVGYGELKPVIPTRPTNNFESFIQLNYRSICQAVGIPYEFTFDPSKLANKGGDIILEKTRAFFVEVQELLIDNFCHRVYAWVISKQLPLSSVRPLGNENPFNCHWTTPAKIGVGRNDVGNRVDSIQNKLSNPYIDAAETGRDADQIMDGWILYQKRFNEKCKAAGVDPTTVVYGKGTTSLKQTEAESDSDKNNDKTESSNEHSSNGEDNEDNEDN
jgi:capsid protein